MLRLIITCILGSLLTAMPAQTNFHTAIDLLRQSYKIAGVAVAYLEDNHVKQLIISGYSDVGLNSRLDLQSMSPTASLSKPVSGIMAQILASKKLIDLDTTPDRYLKNNINLKHLKTDRYAIKQLLNHTAGMRRGSVLKYREGQQIQDLDDIVEKKLSCKKPGRRFYYSAGGYTLFQKLVEDEMDLPYATVAEKILFKPLGMLQSTFSQHFEESKVQQYLSIEKSQEPFRFIIPQSAAGGLWSSIQDLGTFLAFVMQTLDGAQILLDQQTLAQNLNPDPLTVRDFGDDGLIGNALGFYTTIDHNNPSQIIALTHVGGNDGARCFLTCNLTRNNGLIILTNSGHGHVIFPDIKELFKYE